MVQLECRGILPTASYRGFGTSPSLSAKSPPVAFGVLASMKEQDPFTPSDNLNIPGQQYSIPQHPDIGSGDPSLADLYQLDKSEFIHYDQEKRSKKRRADDGGGNRVRCKRYRLAKKQILLEEKKEWQPGAAFIV